MSDEEMQYDVQRELLTKYKDAFAFDRASHPVMDKRPGAGRHVAGCPREAAAHVEQPRRDCGQGTQPRHPATHGSPRERQWYPGSADRHHQARGHRATAG